MNHNHHSCECKHLNVAFCSHCKTVYCKGCNQEWTAKINWNYTYYPEGNYWNSLNTAQANTSGLLSTSNRAFTNTISCSHYDEAK